MPETYGLPEPEEDPITREQRIAAMVAGQGIVRRVVLYSVAYGSLGLVVVAPAAFIPVALIALTLLLATDKGLE